MINNEVRYTQIRDMDIANGEGIGCAVYFQGCPFHCFNCFNESTWDFDSGKLWTMDETNKVYSLMDEKYLKRISFLGGEPMIDRNLDLLIELTNNIKKNYFEKVIWIYSGFLFENLVGDFSNTNLTERQEKCRQILKNCDILVDGQFKDNLKDFKMKFRGSTNQRIIRASQSLLDGSVVIDDKLMQLRDF